MIEGYALPGLEAARTAGTLSVELRGLACSTPTESAAALLESAPAQEEVMGAEEAPMLRSHIWVVALAATALLMCATSSA